MVWSGNIFTSYQYRHCRVDSRRDDRALTYAITTPDAEADLSVTVRIDQPATAPPPDSPFPDLSVARRFAGPLPFTFGYEESTRSMVIVQGLRSNWQPMPVQVEALRCGFLERLPFTQAPLRLANAFLIERIPYRWKRGEVERVPELAP